MTKAGHTSAVKNTSQGGKDQKVLLTKTGEFDHRQEFDPKDPPRGEYGEFISNPTPQPNVAYATGPAPGVYVQQPAPGTMLSAETVMMTCPHCRQPIQTQVTYENGTLTWLLVGGLLIVGCFLGCCLIPTCIDECKDAIHTCPNCKNFIGIKKRV